MKMLALAFAALLIALMAPSSGEAQQASFDRLPAELFDVTPPTARVLGEPGQMRIQSGPCRTLSIAESRRRIVDVAVQEWAFFGFRITDETSAGNASLLQNNQNSQNGAPASGFPSRFSRMNPEEAARVAASIAGYWAATPEGAWILERQNRAWNTRGVATRWSDPWSAAFISWVMCEAGLGGEAQFQRAIAHHSYIDQAIRARDGAAAPAAFAAYDIGEAAIAPGDLLCSGRRPAYRTLAERRRQMGVGARTHCDIVVKLDETDGRIFAIGGNVRGTVSLKVWPAVHAPDQGLRPANRGLFVHLKMRADAIEGNALENTPTIQALGCAAGFSRPLHLAATIRLPLASPAERC